MQHLLLIYKYPPERQFPFIKHKFFNKTPLTKGKTYAKMHR